MFNDLLTLDFCVFSHIIVSCSGTSIDECNLMKKSIENTLLVSSFFMSSKLCNRKLFPDVDMENLVNLSIKFVVANNIEQGEALKI